VYRVYRKYFGKLQDWVLQTKTRKKVHLNVYLQTLAFGDAALEHVSFG
jgi:hypothetical protein